MSPKLLTAALAFCCSTSVLAQVAPGPTRIWGTADKDIPTPMHSTKTQSDTAAIQELIDLVKAIGLTGWKGMVATGTVTIAGDTTPHAAQLSVLGGTQYRLDVTRDAGTESTILNGDQGIFLAADGTRSSISSDIAALGLISIPRLLATSYPALSTILTDRGTLTVSGSTLHRITLDDPSTDGTGNPWKTIDFYFDPATGRLTESVANVHLSTKDAALYILTTTYGDYRGAGLATLPYTYTQSLNGQLQWTLSLSSIDTATVPSPTIFTF